jgi:hypothetical protein
MSMDGRYAVRNQGWCYCKCPWMDGQTLAHRQLRLRCPDKLHPGNDAMSALVLVALLKNENGGVLAENNAQIIFNLN